MQLTSLILAAASFATQASAIDLHAFSGGKCDVRQYFIWTNAQPNVCHETGNQIYIRSFSLTAIPKDWGHVRFAKYKWGEYKCTNPYEGFVIKADGRTDLCSGQDATRYQMMGGAKYWFQTKKRGSEVEEPATQGTECVYPDTFVSDNGQQYNITGLASDAVVKLWESTDVVRRAEFAHLMK